MNHSEPASVNLCLVSLLPLAGPRAAWAFGVPLTMLRAGTATRFLVLEMGARHMGDIAELTGLVAPGGTAVLNADDPRVVAMRSLTDGPVLTFGRADGAGTY